MQKKWAVDLVNVLKITCSILKIHVDANSLYPKIDHEEGTEACYEYNLVNMQALLFCLNFFFDSFNLF